MSLAPTTIGRLLLGATLLVPTFTVALLTGAAPKLSAAPGQPRLAKAGKAHGPGVRALFDQAGTLFEAGKYPEALSAYENILRKYPGHMPAQIQIAKTLYRMERIKEAQAVFAKFNLKEQDLDAETSYEYGWSFYTVKAWEGALAGFQRVPAGHSLFDLANYYGAICAIKLKRLDLAEDMLDKAVVLPDKLAKSRAMYIKHVQALRLLHERASLAQERAQEKDALLPQAVKRPKAKKDLKEAPTVVLAEGPPKHQGFQMVDHAALLKFEVDHQNISSSGATQKSYDATIASFDFTNGILQALPLASGKDDKGNLRQSAVGLQFTLGAENRTTKGTEQRLLSDETWQSLARQLNANLGTSATRSGHLEVEVWGEVPLPASLWATIGGDYSLSYEDFQRGQRIGYRQAYAALRGKYAWGDGGFEGHFAEILGPAGQTIAQVNDLLLFAQSEVAPKLLLGAKLAYDTFDYIGRGIDLDGPDSTLMGALSATQHLPLGIKIQLTGSYQQQTNYIFRKVPSFPAVTADARVLTGKGTLEIAPIPFISAGVSELLATTKWAEKDPNSADSFAVAVPDYVEYFTVWAAVNLAF